MILRNNLNHAFVIMIILKLVVTIAGMEILVPIEKSP